MVVNVLVPVRHTQLHAFRSSSLHHMNLNLPIDLLILPVMTGMTCLGRETIPLPLNFREGAESHRHMGVADPNWSLRQLALGCGTML